MGFVSDYVFGIPRAAAGMAKEFIIDPLTGAPVGARARTPAAQCSGWMLDPATGLEVCVDDLVLDPATGELITTAEAERRAREGLVYDKTGDEWVTPAELRARDRRRASQAEFQRQRAAGELVRDRETEEWVTPEELQRRRRVRNALRIYMEQEARASGQAFTKLPDLKSAAAAMLTLGRDGVARVGDEKATAETLGELEDLEVTDVMDAGPARRDEDAASGRRIVMYAILALALAGAGYALGRT